MASRPLRVSCPECGATIRPPLTDGGADKGATDTLRGRSVACRDCGAGFEVLFYLR